MLHVGQIWQNQSMRCYSVLYAGIVKRPPRYYPRACIWWGVFFGVDFPPTPVSFEGISQKKTAVYY